MAALVGAANLLLLRPTHPNCRLVEHLCNAFCEERERPPYVLYLLCSNMQEATGICLAIAVAAPMPPNFFFLSNMVTAMKFS